MSTKHAVPALALAALLGLAIHAAVLGTLVYVVLADRPSESRCKAALIEIVQDAITNPTAPEVEEKPAPCKGLSEETYQRIAREVIWGEIGNEIDRQLDTGTLWEPHCPVAPDHPDWDYTLACNPDVAEFIEGER